MLPFIVFLKLICLREREREREGERESIHTRAGEGQRDRERENPKEFHDVSTEPHTGINLTNRKIVT